MSEISYENLGILTIQSLIDSTIESIRQIEQKLDDSFIQVSPDLKWGEKYGITMNIPKEALSDFPQLEHPVILMAWKVREDCSSLLDWLIEGEHERVIPLDQANPQEYSDRLDKIDKQITQDIKDKKNEAVYDCAEVYCLVEGLKAEVAERDRLNEALKRNHSQAFATQEREIEERERQIAQMTEDSSQILRLNHDYNESTDNYREQIEERDRQILRLNHDYNESTDGYLIQIDGLKRELEFVKNLHDLAIGELGELASVEHEARLKGSLIEILVKVIHRLEEE